MATCTITVYQLSIANPGYICIRFGDGGTVECNGISLRHIDIAWTIERFFELRRHWKIIYIGAELGTKLTGEHHAYRTSLSTVIYYIQNSTEDEFRISTFNTAIFYYHRTEPSAWFRASIWIVTKLAHPSSPGGTLLFFWSSYVKLGLLRSPMQLSCATCSHCHETEKGLLSSLLQLRIALIMTSLLSRETYLSLFINC